MHRLLILGFAVRIAVLMFWIADLLSSPIFVVVVVCLVVSLCGYSTGCSGFSGGFWVLVVVGFLWVSGFVCCSGLVGFVLVVCCLRRGGWLWFGWLVG